MTGWANFSGVKCLKIQNETSCALIEDPLNVHKNASNEITLVSQVSSLIDQENAVLVLAQGKTLVNDVKSVLNDGICDKLQCPCLLLEGKFGKNINWDVSISLVWYFNWRFLSLNQTFASDPNYIFCQVCVWGASSGSINKLCNVQSKTRSAHCRDKQTKLEGHNRQICS